MDLIDRSQSRGKNSVGPVGARHRGYVWSSCCGPHLGSGHVRPPQQTGHMAAIASIRNPLPPLASRGPSTDGTLWCKTPRLCLELVLWTPSWQCSCATATTDRTYGRNRFDQKPASASCQQGAVHICGPHLGSG